MITVILSERDFDYEIQALVNSFFPSEQSRIIIEGEGTAWDAVAEKGSGEGSLPEAGILLIRVRMGKQSISVSMLCRSVQRDRETSLAAPGDWHKREGKKAHPYRRQYKNELKKALFLLLRDFPEESLPSSLSRRIPAWGTMTGVRPTKIVMQELLSASSESQARQELEKSYLCSPEKVDLGLQVAKTENRLLKGHFYERDYSLYIGIPFCPTTCLYCSFPSYPLETFGHLTEEYLRALKKEIRAAAEWMAGRNLVSVYIGGGTPTALSAGQLEDLMLHLRACFPIEEACEYTVEAGRPDSISREKLQVLWEQGVSRISVNPQSMQQKTLDLIGRRHTLTQTIEAFQLARAIGFQNINMDLIIGLPGEDVPDFQDSLKRIHALDPDAVTIHSLVIKRASGLRMVLEEQAAAGRISMEELERARGERMERMLEISREFALRYGYAPYYMYRQKNSAGHAGSTGQENIGYARDGKECLYNILIMEEVQTIVALGAGASTKLYHPKLKQVSRVENVKSVMDYIARVDEMIERKREALQNNAEEWRTTRKAKFS